MPLRTSILSICLGCSVSLLLSGCGDDSPRGELMVSVTTDLAVPNDIDHLTWIITPEGSSAPQTINLDLKNGTDLPATLAIESSPGSTSAITVRVEGRKGVSESLLRVVREARVVVPTDRVARLNLSLSWLCSESNLAESCGARMTCQAGHCVDSEVEVAALPDFQPSPTRDCYDVTACAEDAPRETPNPMTLSNGEKIACGISGTNPLGLDADVTVLLIVDHDQVGLSGFCDLHDDCYVPLQRSDTVEGWRVVENGDTPTIELPAVVCEKSGTSITQVAVARASPSCPSPQADQPLCSPDSARCLAADFCPPTSPNPDWLGYACARGSRVDDPDLLKCWSPAASDGDSPDDGRWCCLRDQTPSEDPLLIDDMHDGPQIKRKPLDGQAAGWWFAEIPDGSGDLSPPPDPALYTYRQFTPPVGPSGGPQFDAAACLSSQGFHGWFAIEGFFFASRRGEYGSVKLDVTDYAGISFWGWADEPFEDDPQSVTVTFPNIQASTEPSSDCVRATGNATRCDSFAKELDFTSQWQHYFVSWSELEQSSQDWGQIYFEKFEPQIFAVTFGVKGAGPSVQSQSFDFCVTDIRFEKEPPP